MVLKRFAIGVLALALLAGGFFLYRARIARGQTVAQTFLFTWPGDDGNVGTASSLELRWSRNAIVGTDTLSWWNGATRWTGTYPAPKIAGTPDSVIVLGMPSDTFIYAIVKACDEAPNCSGYSNVASGRTKDFVPPGRVTDLRLGELLRRLFRPSEAMAAESDPPAAVRNLRLEARLTA